MIKLFYLLSSVSLASFVSFALAADTPPLQRAALRNPSEALGIQTLESALAQTYLQNPDLDSQRAKLRQTDEGVSQAVSEWRPTITGSLSQQNQRLTTGSGNYGQRNRQIGVTVNQNLFAGGGTTARIAKAESDVLAGKQNLISAEQSLFFNVVQVFMNVLTERKIITFLKKSESFLKQTLESTKVKYEVGEVTQTDIASAEASLAQATAKRIASEGRLETARATFIKLVGKVPGSLTYPEITMKLPTTSEAAVALALQASPSFKASQFAVDSAKHNVDAQIANLLPSLDTQAQAQRSVGHSPTTSNGTSRNLGVTVSLTVPLYDGGRNRSQVRQADQAVTQARLDQEGLRRSAVSDTVAAWSDVQTTTENVSQYEVQVKASDLALRSVSTEYEYGSKSLLDLLDVEAKWNEAQISLLEAQRDKIIATYKLVAVTGQLTAKALKLPVPVYDPDKYYNEYRDAWFSLGGEEPEPLSLRNEE